MRRPLIAGNWKMHGDRASARRLASAIASAAPPLQERCDLAVFPPFVHLELVGALLAGSGVALGAQDLSTEPPGARTGEVCAEMLLDLDCRYALVGHSERRTLLGEDDREVARKFARAAQSGLCPVLCVGETAEERDAGHTLEVIERQLSAVAEAAGAPALGAAVLAYEPVWAIGTGRSATPAQAQEVHAFIRDRLRAMAGAVAGQVRILYGGSVKPDNAGALFSMTDIDGGLIGGASLEAESFLAICANA